MQHSHEESQGAYQPHPEQQSFTSAPDSSSAVGKQKTGRNWVISIVSALVAAIVVYAVLALVTRDKTPDLDYTYSTAEFSVDFPGEPTVEMIPGVDGNSIPLAGWENKNGMFAAGYVPLIEPGVSIEESVMGAFLGAEGTLEDISEFPVEGGQGLLGEGAHDPTDGKMWVLAVFVEGDEGGFSVMHIGDEMVPEFFDSFEISDEFLESVGN